MNTNLSTLDRYVRLVGGIMLVSSALSMRKSIMKQTVMAVGAMKVAEGAIGWCPIMHMMGVKDTKTAVQLQGSQDSSQPQNRKQTTDKKGAQRMDTPRMDVQENSPDQDTLSPIEAHRVLEGSDALNTTYQ